MCNWYENPANGYREIGETTFSWLWCLIFGFIYFAYKGAWRHAFVGFGLAIVTSGLSWLVYPFFAYGIVARSYGQRGWRRVLGARSGPPPLPQTDPLAGLRS